MGPADTGSAVPDANGESEIVRRSPKDLAVCLSCDICTGLLQEPYTAPVCMHCYCHKCIDAFIVPGQGTNCPVCQADGVVTSFGNQPYRDHLRPDFTLRDLLKKVAAQLASVTTTEQHRIEQWHALSRVLQERAAATAEPAAKPLRQLPPDGAGCVELYIAAPEDHELEQPYMRVHENVTVAVMVKFLQERILSVTEKASLQLSLRCRDQRLSDSMTMGEIESVNSPMTDLDTQDLNVLICRLLMSVMKGVRADKEIRQLEISIGKKS